MLQTKEQDKTSEGQLSEMKWEKAIYPRKEFRVMNIKMIQELGKRMDSQNKKLQEVFIKNILSLVQFNHSVVSGSLPPHGLQHARLPCPWPTPSVCSNSCPSSQWCHPTISSSVIPFCSCLQSCPASGSFLMSQFFTSGGQTIGAPVSASFLPMNIQDWFPLGLTGLITWQARGLSIVFSNNTVQKHQFFSAQLSLGFPAGSNSK